VLGDKFWKGRLRVGIFVCLDVTIVPTYDTDTLGYWVVDSEVALAEGRIDLAPSASRCT